MTFEILETITKVNAKPMASMSYMRPYSKRGNKGAPRLVLTIPTTICGTSKSRGWKIMIGSGENAGKLRVVGAEGGIVPAELKHAFRWNFGHLPRLGEDIFDGEKFPVTKIDDETFEITVPADFFGPAPAVPQTGSGVKPAKESRK